MNSADPRMNSADPRMDHPRVGVDPERPLVVACLRITDLRPRVDPLTGAVSRDPWGFGLAPADEAALEHALRIAEAWSGRALAVTLGPPSSDRPLRNAVAAGASALRIPSGRTADGEGYAQELAGDEQHLARTIAAALSPLAPTLVLCGDRSVDRGTGALPAFLAHALGAAQALGLVTLDVDRHETDGDEPVASGRALIAERRLDAGWRERLRVPLPAVCSVEGAGIRLRRAPLPAFLAAETAVIPVAGPAPDAGFDGAAATPRVRVGRTEPFEPRTRVLPAPGAADPRLRLLTLTGALVAHDAPTVVGPVGAAEAADEMLRFLARHGYFEPPSDSGRLADGVDR